MSRTDLTVAVVSILVVAGVIAIPLATPTAAVPSQALPLPTTSASAGPLAGLVGSGCAAYAASVPTGAGSIVGMSQDPVAVAAASNPQLKTLTAALSGKLNSGVNLVRTLDNAQLTVFAPVDAAFAKLPVATLTALKNPADAAPLSSLLEYHVVSGQFLPTAIDGTHTTLQGETLTVSGSGDAMTVNGAHVICGGIHTANATVYLIDTVLSPPAK
jgi:uncharacterized surface protein with fasciclin (FAS1) repeats